jgi:hypothetical protein
MSKIYYVCVTIGLTFVDAAISCYFEVTALQGVSFCFGMPFLVFGVIGLIKEK